MIGFKNGAASELAQALGNAMSETLIWDAARFASDGAQFLDALDAKHAKATGSNLNLTAEQAELAQHRFAYLRDEQDTYKAVHRLTLLGVVDDYTLDYGAKTITLSLNRLPSDENDCIGRLASYLERYTTTVRALEIADRARLRKRGHSLLEKALGQLLDFIDEYAAYAAKFDPRVAEYIRQHVREQVLFDVQLRWLKQFNDRFDDRPTDERRHQDAVTS